MADDIASLFASMTPEQRGSGLTKDLILTELARLRAENVTLRDVIDHAERLRHIDSLFQGGFKPGIGVALADAITALAKERDEHRHADSILRKMSKGGWIAALAIQWTHNGGVALDAGELAYLRSITEESPRR